MQIPIGDSILLPQREIGRNREHQGRQAVQIEDVAATRTIITGEDLPSATLRDPDGHIIANQLW